MFTLFPFLSLALSSSIYLTLYLLFLSLSVHSIYPCAHVLSIDPYTSLSLSLSPLFFHGFLFNRQSTSRYGLMAMILHSRSTSRGRVIRRQIRSDGRPCRQFRIGMATVVQSTVDNPIKRAAKISVRIPGFARVSNFFRHFYSLFSISLQRVSFSFLSFSSTPLNLSISSRSFPVAHSCHYHHHHRYPSLFANWFFASFGSLLILLLLLLLLSIVWISGSLVFSAESKNARKKLNRWVHASDMLQQLIELWDAMEDEQLWIFLDDY